MTRTEYLEYQAAVERNLSSFTHASSGPCPGCSECGLADIVDINAPACEDAGEPFISSLPCGACGNGLQGDRYPAHAILTTRDAFTDAKENEIVHLDICPDCVYYLEYGKLDDQTMDEKE